ncbi:hypothetical protein DH2020_015146 [Rehmannia glutinosa]|uniref:Laccase n=1 Tax=Rehmannia glutinosa TaxID=99300 RepID=A0ABR0WYY1_REHGL
MSALPIIVKREFTKCWIVHPPIGNVVMKNTSRLCSTKPIVTVNGKFPGPTIYAREDDTVLVKVVNHVKYNVSIHWHGIRQLRTGWADGPAYITQCPIQPGHNYVYNFTITGQRGTLLWHAHILWLRATLHGAIVILPKLGVPYPFPKPNHERVVILGEWWKSDTEAVINEALKSGLAPNVSIAHNQRPSRACPKLFFHRWLHTRRRPRKNVPSSANQRCTQRRTLLQDRRPQINHRRSRRCIRKTLQNRHNPNRPGPNNHRNPNHGQTPRQIHSGGVSLHGHAGGGGAFFKIKGVFTTDFPGNPKIAFNYTGKPPASFATENGTKLYRLPYNSTVQVVLQDTGIIAPENHPVHLHGFNFFAVGRGLGNFNPEIDPKKFNLVDPVERNTIGVPSGGWVAIRFRADNPGVWFMHCHLEIHTTWGLKMAFLVDNGKGPNESLLPPPKDLPKC